MFRCMECGRKFKTTAAAERAADCGCPRCGSVDIDLDTRHTWEQQQRTMVERVKLQYPSEVQYIEGQ